MRLSAQRSNRRGKVNQGFEHRAHERNQQRTASRDVSVAEQGGGAVARRGRLRAVRTREMKTRPKFVEQ